MIKITASRQEAGSSAQVATGAGSSLHVRKGRFKYSGARLLSVGLECKCQFNRAFEELSERTARPTCDLSHASW